MPWSDQLGKVVSFGRCAVFLRAEFFCLSAKGGMTGLSEILADGPGALRGLELPVIRPIYLHVDLGEETCFEILSQAYSEFGLWRDALALRGRRSGPDPGLCALQYGR